MSGKPIVAKDGRFGMYVTDGEYNATLRKDDSIDTLTPERPRSCWPSAARRVRPRRPAKKAAKKTAKKTAKKAPAKKSAAPRRSVGAGGTPTTAKKSTTP